VRDRLTHQDGFTLVELMMTMVLGLLVTGALFSVIVSAERATKRVGDRVDATQRGRTAISRMTQELRAMVCLPDTATRPIVEGTDTQVTWYSNLDSDAAIDADGDGDPTFDPAMRRLEIASAPSGQAIVESRWDGALPVVAGTPPDRQSSLVAGVEPLESTPVFRFYGYADASATVPTLLPTPLSADDLSRVAQIDVAFVTAATSTGADPRGNVVMRSSVYARTIRRSSTATPVFECST